jgi:hypothetical protein
MEKSSPLDTTSIRAVYKAQDIEPHEKYGPGEWYQFGAIKIELYFGLLEAPPIVCLRVPGGMLFLTDVSNVTPSQDGGVLIDCAKQGQKPHCSISINRIGDIAIVYSPPPKPMQISQSGVMRRSGGLSFTQSTIEIEGTPEGVRVQVRGTIDAAPRLVDPKSQRSPLMFFLIEENLADPDNPVYHEVWAINKPKQELKALKLTKGKLIEAILFRHTYEVELISGEKETLTRHNLVKVIYVEKNERGHSAQRQRNVE